MIMGWVRPPRPPRPPCLSDVKVANVAVRHGQCLRRGPCLLVSRPGFPGLHLAVRVGKKTQFLPLFALCTYAAEVLQLRPL
jgi:hypothetical protein